MNLKQFNELVAADYNRIPLLREMNADLDTPLSIYLKLASESNTYLFESMQGGEKWGRYSLIGLSTNNLLKLTGDHLQIIADGHVQTDLKSSDPLGEIQKFKDSFRVPDLPNMPRFTGGLVGYFGYDSVRYVEKKLATSTPPDQMNIPDVMLLVSEELIIFDNLAGTITLVVHADPSVPDTFNYFNRRLDLLEIKLASTSANPFDMTSGHQKVSEDSFVSSFGEERYKEAVRKIKDYTIAGDIMQVVPSQRLSAPFFEEPINLYRSLRRLNPSPYMYYINLEDFFIVGSSPEVLARLENDVVTVRPIAGTRRRGVDEAEDKALERDLMEDPKELAEHLMLIDLGRNDVGRISKSGSVEVTEKMIVERYSHVMHITSNVTGNVQENLTSIDIIKAVLPAGTLSGAPKIRAMEIIDEVEPVKRNIYGGAVGYLGWNNNMDMAIAIRTAVVKDNVLHVQAGGGVVADSDPQMEWEETMNKARAIIRAAESLGES